MTNQNSLWDCNCMNRDHKLLILRVFKEAIENQKDIDQMNLFTYD